MELARTFQAIEETRFLKKLSLQERLLFVGDKEVIEYIQNFFKQIKPADNNFYYDLSSNSLKDFFILLESDRNYHTYQAIVVASIDREAKLFSRITNNSDRLNITIPIVRLFADLFINIVCQRELLQLTSDELIKPGITYAILTTPRSGSTYFCDLLSSTKIAGYPQEHLRLAAQELARNFNFDYQRLLYNLVQYRTTENGVFGTKLISHFWLQLRQTKPNFRKFFKAIDKYLLLVRQDKIAQAVSLVLAQKTEVWHILKNTQNENSNYQAYKSSLEDIQIDDKLLLEVDEKHKFIISQEKRLRQILKGNQIEPLEIIYEDVVENTEFQINRVLDFLEIPKPSKDKIILNSGIKKMPSNISQEIIRQYKLSNKESTLCQ